MWTRGLQAGPTTVVGRSSQHLPRITTKVLDGTMDVVLPEVTPLKVDLTYPENPIKVLDQKGCVTRPKTIMFFKIQ
jgi:hypothetical protein